jgi:hypothetical protein
VTSEPFVPPDFVVPLRLETPQFVLEPLGPQHNDRDYAAWSSSMEHIHGTPGWEESKWPRAMTLDENRADLERHASDFANRTGFTYTVLSPEGDVMGCVYIYPSKKEAMDAVVQSWVRAKPISTRSFGEPSGPGSIRTGRSSASTMPLVAEQR